MYVGEGIARQVADVRANDAPSPVGDDAGLVGGQDEVTLRQVHGEVLGLDERGSWTTTPSFVSPSDPAPPCIVSIASASLMGKKTPSPEHMTCMSGASSDGSPEANGA